MQLSTVKRERLIPPAYLLSIGLLLTIAFVVLMPSRDNFTINPQSSAEDRQVEIDDLDVAYVRANSASGNMPSGEMQSVIGALIRGQRWQDARTLMAERPDITINDNDLFLLQQLPL